MAPVLGDAHDVDRPLDNQALGVSPRLDKDGCTIAGLRQCFGDRCRVAIFGVDDPFAFDMPLVIAVSGPPGEAQHGQSRQSQHHHPPTP
jgi:hypothetical protein